MSPEDPTSAEQPQSRFKITLIRVLVVQVVALALLWLLQMRYHV